MSKRLENMKKKAEVLAWTCKRCGAKTESESSEPTGMALFMLPRGWEYVKTDLLCNDCMYTFDKLIWVPFMKRLLP